MRDKYNPENVEKVFRQDWVAGHEYDLGLLKERVVPVLDKLREENKLGHVIADIGSGRFGVSSLMDYPETKIIRVDIAAINMEDGNMRQFIADLRNIEKPSFAEKRELANTRKWLRDHDIPVKNEPVVDTAILTAVLNYVPYKKVVPEILKYIKVGGRLIIFNAPDRGAYTHSQVFSPERATNNIQIVSLLEKELKMDVETESFGGNSVAELEELPRKEKIKHTIEKGYMLLVARKTKED